MKLSENFSLDEMTATGTGLPNDPDATQVEKLLYLVTFILQPTRRMFGAIKITSGFRSSEVNQSVGGSPTSQHCFGEAADIVPTGRGIKIFALFDYMSHHYMGQYGQIIREKRGYSQWIHVSLPRVDKKNGEALIYEDGVYRPYNEMIPDNV